MSRNVGNVKFLDGPGVGYEAAPQLCTVSSHPATASLVKLLANEGDMVALD